MALIACFMIMVTRSESTSQGLGCQEISALNITFIARCLSLRMLKADVISRDRKDQRKVRLRLLKSIRV